MFALLCLRLPASCATLYSGGVSIAQFRPPSSPFPDFFRAGPHSGQPAEWAYGNAETDTLAWQEGGVADDHIFLVGERAGTMGVVGLTDDEAYTTHMAGQMAAVQPTECAR